jgi:hypothetical protein
MKIEEMIKLNNKMSNKYCVIPKLNNGWILLREGKFDSYIMSSDNNTEDELIEFVKKHTIYNLGLILSKSQAVITFSLCVLNIINSLFIHSKFLSAWILGALFITLITVLILEIVTKHDAKVNGLILKEDIERLSKETEKIYKKISTNKTIKPRKTRNKKEEEKKD